MFDVAFFIPKLLHVWCQALDFRFKYQKIKCLQGVSKLAFLSQSHYFLQILENLFQIENKYLSVSLLNNKKVAVNAYSDF